MLRFVLLAAGFAAAFAMAAEAQQDRKREKRPAAAQQSAPTSGYVKPCAGVHFVENDVLNDSCRLPDGRVCDMVAGGSHIELRNCKK